MSEPGLSPAVVDFYEIAIAAGLTREPDNAVLSCPDVSPDRNRIVNAGMISRTDSARARALAKC